MASLIGMLGVAAHRAGRGELYRQMVKLEQARRDRILEYYRIDKQMENAEREREFQREMRRTEREYQSAEAEKQRGYGREEAERQREYSAWAQRQGQAFQAEEAQKSREAQQKRFDKEFEESKRRYDEAQKRLNKQDELQREALEMEGKILSPEAKALRDSMGAEVKPPVGNLEWSDWQQRERASMRARMTEVLRDETMPITERQQVIRGLKKSYDEMIPEGKLSNQEEFDSRKVQVGPNKFLIPLPDGRGYQEIDYFPKAGMVEYDEATGITTIHDNKGGTRQIKPAGITPKDKLEAIKIASADLAVQENPSIFRQRVEEIMEILGDTDKERGKKPAPPQGAGNGPEYQYNPVKGWFELIGGGGNMREMKSTIASNLVNAATRIASSPQAMAAEYARASDEERQSILTKALLKLLRAEDNETKDKMMTDLIQMIVWAKKQGQ